MFQQYVIVRPDPDSHQPTCFNVPVDTGNDDKEVIRLLRKYKSHRNDLTLIGFGCQRGIFMILRDCADAETWLFNTFPSIIRMQDRETYKFGCPNELFHFRMLWTRIF